MFVLSDCFDKERTDEGERKVESEMVSGVCALENDECICNFSLWIRGKVHLQTKNIISSNDSLFCLDHFKFQSALLNA